MRGDVEADGLSVVIASIGRAGVARTVASLLAAGRAADRPVHVIVAWQGAHPPPDLPAGVEIVNVLPLGASAGRNAGVARVHTPLVGFVDDDEVVDAGWVTATLAAFEDPAVDAAFGQVLPLDDGLPYCVLRFDRPRVVRGHALAPWDVGTGGNMAFRRQVLDELGRFDSHLGPATPSRSGEDTDLIVRLLTSGRVLAQRSDMVVFHPTKDAAEILASRRPYGRGMGALARRHRSPRLVLQFVVGAMWALREAVRGDQRRRLRELLATLHGWLEGVLLAVGHTAPTELISRAPADVVAAIGGRPVHGLRVPDDPEEGVGYRCGSDLLLRVWPSSSGGACWELTGVGGQPRVASVSRAWQETARPRGSSACP